LAPFLELQQGEEGKGLLAAIVAFQMLPEKTKSVDK
jgi:hypothetical protein